MNSAMALAVLAGTGWACNIVVVRWALARTGADPLVAATVGVGIAAVLATLMAVLAGDGLPAGGDLWRFAVVGAIAPGSSQGLFVASIGTIGPSRASVLVGTSPVFSVLLAILFLDEGWRWAIVVGTLLSVVGGALLSWEPWALARRVGIFFALITAFTFGVRDVVARQFGSGSEVSAWWAGAIVLGAAAVVLLGMVLLRDGHEVLAKSRACLPEFAASGLAIGLALPVLLEALDRGEVGVVAPLSLAAQNITVVALSAAVFGRQERSPRVIAALVLVLAGAALITST